MREEKEEEEEDEKEEEEEKEEEGGGGGGGGGRREEGGGGGVDRSILSYCGTQGVRGQDVRNSETSPVLSIWNIMFYHLEHNVLPSGTSCFTRT